MAQFHVQHGVHGVAVCTSLAAAIKAAKRAEAGLPLAERMFMYQRRDGFPPVVIRQGQKIVWESNQKAKR